MTAPGWLTTGQAATLSGLGRSTVYRWIRDGLIPSNALIRTGNRSRIARWWVMGQAAP